MNWFLFLDYIINILNIPSWFQLKKKTTKNKFLQHLKRIRKITTWLFSVQIAPTKLHALVIKTAPTHARFFSFYFFCLLSSENLKISTIGFLVRQTHIFHTNHIFLNRVSLFPLFLLTSIVVHSWIISNYLIENRGFLAI